MSGHTALCDVGDSISDSKVSIMSVVTLYHERDLSQEPQSNDSLSYLSRHRTMLSHGRMLAYWMNIKTWREACQGPSALFKPLLGSSGHMSPTIYLNSVSYMMPVLVCSAGSPRVWAFLRLSRLVPFQLAGNRICLPNPTAWSSFRILRFSLHSAEDLEHPLLRGHRLTGKNRQFSGMLTCLVSTFKRSSKKLILKDLATKMMWSPLLPTFPYCLVSQTLGSTTVKTVQTVQRDHSFLLLVQ